MANDFKDLFSSGMYKSFQHNLNFFSYFNISSDDLENAMLFMDQGANDFKSLQITTENNIKNMLTMLTTHSKDENGKYTKIIPNDQLKTGKAYVVGMLMTAIRLLSQETIFVLNQSKSSMQRINVPIYDGTLRHNIRDYQYGIRVYLEGISIWFYNLLDDSNETRDILLRHDFYLDKNIFNISEYRNLFVWIWIWSNLRVANNYNNWAKNDNSIMAFPSLTKNCLRPFRLFINDEEHEKYADVISEFSNNTEWANDETGHAWETIIKGIRNRITYNGEISYSEYFDVLETISETFSIFAGFQKDGYVDTLAGTLYENHKIVATGTRLSDIIDELQYHPKEVAWNERQNIEDNFYENGLYNRPLITFLSDGGEKIIISYPELITLAKTIRKKFNYAEPSIMEVFEKTAQQDYKKFLVNEIGRIEKRNGLKYFKFKNNYRYLMGNARKNNIIEFDQGFYDVSATHLFLCQDFFFSNNIEVWKNLKNDATLFLGDHSLMIHFVQNKIKKMHEQFKYLKRDFGISNETKVTAVMFTNEEFQHPSKYVFDDFDLYVINYTNIDFFLKTLVYKKNFLELNINNYLLESDSTSKSKKNRKKKL